MKKTLFLFVPLIWLAVLVCPAASAKKKPRVQRPLPAKVLNAKTVAFVDQTAMPGYSDREYSKLVEWGRFKVVERTQNPDLLLVFTMRDEAPTYVTSGSSDTTVNVPSGNCPGCPITATTSSRHKSVPVGGNIPVLSVVDAATSEVLWVVTGYEAKRWFIFYSINPSNWGFTPLDQLRKRVETQEKGNSEPLAEKPRE